MLLRVRTNLGITRIEVSDKTTLLELKEKIKEVLKINYPAVALTLSLHVDGQEPINDNQARLIDLGIRHGSEIFVVGRFEKHTVEKSFVGSDGNVVAAGTTLNFVEEHDDAELDEIMGTNNMSVIDSTAESISSAMRKEGSTSLTPPAEAALESAAAQESAVEGPTLDHDHSEYNSIMSYQDEDNVRAPDAAQSMMLLDEPRPGEGGFNLSSTEGGRMLMHAVLTDEENAQVAQLERTLREAGLREYEVLGEVQQLQDELIARRLQRDSSSSSADNMGDALTAAMYQNNVLGQDMLGQMERMDRTLERFHSMKPKAEVLRLPAHPQPSAQPTRSTRPTPAGTATTSSQPIRGNTVKLAGKKSTTHKEDHSNNANSVRSSAGKSRLSALQQAALQSFPPATAGTSAGRQTDKRHLPSGEKASTASARKPASAPAAPSSIHNRHVPLSAGPLGLSEADASASLLQDSVDEEALLMMLSDEYTPFAETTARPQVGDRRTAPVRHGNNKARTAADKVATTQPPMANKKEAVAEAPSSRSSGGPAGLGLKGCGYKTMAQVRAERIGTIGTVRSASLKVSGSAASTQSSGPAAEETAMHSSHTRPCSRVKASVRSQKTGASNYSTAPHMRASPVEMDETLALALQLSLESTEVSAIAHSPDPAPQPHSGSRVPTNYPVAADRPRIERPYAPESRAGVHLNRPHDLGTGSFERTLRETGAAVDYARRLQEQCDAETAAEIMRIEAEDAAAARLYQEEFNREVESAQLRENLFHRDIGNARPGGAGTDWLDRAVNQHANAGLFKLGVQRSIEPVPYDAYDFGMPRAAAIPARPAVMAAAPPQSSAMPALFDPMLVEYDQEDELLARAMQESLNEEDYHILD